MKKIILLLLLAISLNANQICIEEQDGEIYCIDKDGNTTWIFIKK